MLIHSVAFGVCAYQMGTIIDFDYMSLYVQMFENFMPTVSICSHMILLGLQCSHAQYAILAMRQQATPQWYYHCLEFRDMQNGPSPPPSISASTSSLVSTEDSVS